MSASSASTSEPAWRLILDGAAPGPWNMAVDEAILEGVAAGSSQPTLRFYGWAPPCLSLGYFQRVEVVDATACAALGVDIVRRPTGGRAILHDAELTYSLCLPAAVLGHDAGILPSYYRISRALQGGLAALGVMTTMAPESAAPTMVEHGAACFDRPSAHEILLHGRKLVGSAQVRRGGAILQHGSLLIEPRLERLAACLAGGGEEATRLQAAVAGLAEAGVRDLDRLALTIAAAIEKEFGVRLGRGSVSAVEKRAARALEASKYRTRDWTERPLSAAATETTRTR